MNTLPHHLWIGFAGGLLAFAHCLGMCGGFVLHLSQEKDGPRMVTAQLLWQTGRLFTYLFLGALAGYAGAFLELVFLDQALFRNGISLAAGAIILLMGLSLLGLLPVRGNERGGRAEAALTAICRKLFTAASPGAALAMGITTGLLPCPIVIAFLAYSLQTGAVLSGMATMAGLGMGTMLPLLLLGGATRLAGLHLRSFGAKAGGVILVLLGLCTALRGTALYHQLLGCPSKPAQSQTKINDSKPCCAGELNGNRSGR